MCSGKTHLLCSAAVVSTALLAAGLPTPTAAVSDRVVLGGGLVIIGVLGGLFPDLDAPESELLHAPRKLSRGAGRAAIVLLNLRHGSPARVLVQSILDLPGVFIGGLLAGLSLAIRSVSHHRGLTHELRGMALFTGLLLLLIANLAMILRQPSLTVLNITLLIGVPWTLGYLSHLLLDAATISGIPLLSSRRMFHLLPRGRRIRTGTWPDTLLLRGVACAWLIPVFVLALRP